MNRKQFLGSILKYHQLKFSIPLKSFLYSHDKSICTPTVYTKVAKGIYEVDSIYINLLKANKIVVKDNADADTYFKQLGFQIKQLIEDFQYEKLECLLNEVEMGKYNFYPYLYYYDVLDFIRYLFVDFNSYKRNQLSLLKICFDILPKDLWLCFAYGLFANTLRTSKDVSSISKEMEFLANNEEDEIILYIIKEKLNKVNRAPEKSILYLDKIIEKEAVQTMYNLQIICYQDYHACYFERKDYDQANFYLDSIASTVAKYRVELSSFCVNASLHYLAMQYFYIHDLEKSYPYLCQNVEHDMKCTAIMKLVYFHVSAMLNKEVDLDLLSVKDDTMSATDKLLFKYFEMYFSKVNRARLKEFICNRLGKVLGSENVFERHIVLEQLLQLKAMSEFEYLYAHYQLLDYDIFQRWKEYFDVI